MAAAGILFAVVLVLAIAVPLIVYAGSRSDRIGDGSTDRGDAEQWARRDGDDGPDRDRE